MSSSNWCEHSSETGSIAYYADLRVKHVPRGTPYGKKVLRNFSLAIIKFGVVVKRDEADSQAKAYKLTDHEIIRIPQVYQFFTDVRSRAYLVMEFMDGEVTKPPETLVEVAKIGRILDH